MPEPVANAAAGGKGFLTKKVGPLPLWSWALVAGGTGLALRAVLGGKPAVTTTSRGTAAARVSPYGGVYAGGGGGGAEPPAVMPKPPVPIHAALPEPLPLGFEPWIGPGKSGRAPAPQSEPLTPPPQPHPEAPTRVSAPHEYPGIPGGALVQTVTIGGTPFPMSLSDWAVAHGATGTRATSPLTPPASRMSAPDVALASGPSVPSSGVGASPSNANDQARANRYEGPYWSQFKPLQDTSGLTYQQRQDIFDANPNGL